MAACGIRTEVRVVIGDRALEVALRVAREAAVVVRAGVCGIAPERLAQVPDRAREIALRLPDEPAVVPCARVCLSR